MGKIILSMMVVCGFIGAFTYKHYLTDRPVGTTPTENIEMSEIFKGWDKTQNIEVTYINLKTQDFIASTNKIIPAEIHNAAAYEARYIFKNEENNFADIYLQVLKPKKKISAVLKGFEPRQVFMVGLNDNAALAYNLSLDWAGRGVVEWPIGPQTTSICLGWDDKEFCHPVSMAKEALS